MIRAANHVKQSLLAAGADHAEVKETSGWPVVYGYKMVDESLPTVLVYGHYDVQPAEPLDLVGFPAL
jgi:acetylornithine deacetylase/succinyl-diaminopimelate desuccinylase-like protein